MLESKVEKHLVAEVKKRGGLCLKLDAATYAGIPDRLVIMPGEPPRFVEVKRPKGGRLAELQDAWREQLEALGQGYSLIRDLDEVDELMAMYDRRAVRSYA